MNDSAPVDDIFIHAVKKSVILCLSDEWLYGPKNPRPGHTEPPAAEDVAAFDAWKAKFAPLFDDGARHGWFNEGSEYDEFEYTPPGDRWVYDDEDHEA